MAEVRSLKESKLSIISVCGTVGEGAGSNSDGVTGTISGLEARVAIVDQYSGGLTHISLSKARSKLVFTGELSGESCSRISVGARLEAEDGLELCELVAASLGGALRGDDWKVCWNIVRMGKGLIGRPVVLETWRDFRRVVVAATWLIIGVLIIRCKRGFMGLVPIFVGLISA
jgi:hypothetical protein